MISEIDICSAALLAVGGDPIQSFDEETASAGIAKAFYALVRDTLLASYPWNFAHDVRALARLADAPRADYAYAYALPADSVSIQSLGEGGRSRGLVYRRSGTTVIETDAESVIISYTRRLPPDALPAYFRHALTLQLAAEFCIPLTENTGRWEALQAAADRSLAVARRIDAQQDTPDAIESWPLIEARG